MRTANRLRQYLIEKGINNREADDLFGFSNGLTGKFLAGKTVLSVERIESILSAFPDLNGDWLLNGRGPKEILGREDSLVKESLAVYNESKLISQQLQECQEKVRAKDETIEALKETIKLYKSMIKNRTFST